MDFNSPELAKDFNSQELVNLPPYSPQEGPHSLTSSALAQPSGALSVGAIANTVKEIPPAGGFVTIQGSSTCGPLPQPDHASTPSLHIGASQELANTVMVKDFTTQELSSTPCGPLPQSSHASLSSTVHFDATADEAVQDFNSQSQASTDLGLLVVQFIQSQLKPSDAYRCIDYITRAGAGHCTPQEAAFKASYLDPSMNAMKTAIVAMDAVAFQQVLSALCAAFMRHFP
eukprot:10192377-Karenia_brevis.AAC.1